MSPNVWIVFGILMVSKKEDFGKGSPFNEKKYIDMFLRHLQSYLGHKTYLTKYCVT